jgi:hypothetical protein
MTHKNIDHILQEEAEYVEQHKDAPLSDGTVITHKNQRSYVFSIRLSESERTALWHIANRTEVAPSSLARQWIAERLVSEVTSTDVLGVADTLEILASQLRALDRDVENGPRVS